MNPAWTQQSAAVIRRCKHEDLIIYRHSYGWRWEVKSDLGKPFTVNDYDTNYGASGRSPNMLFIFKAAQVLSALEAHGENWIFTVTLHHRYVNADNSETLRFQFFNEDILAEFNTNTNDRISQALISRPRWWRHLKGVFSKQVQVK